MLFCLSVLPTALRAQGYHLSDRLPYHAASVYYVTLQNAAGEPVNSQYSDTEGAIGAFVGDELRGASQWMATDGRNGIFVVRVWGDETDEATASFRIRDKRGLEYMMGTQPFAKDQEGTYGTPSAPIAMTIEPVAGISLPFSEITLQQGTTYSVQPSLIPEGHTTLLTKISYTYSSDVAAFSVSEGGMITATALGEGKLTVKTTPGDLTAQATVKVEAGTQHVAVEEIKNNMASASIEMTEGEKLLLDFSVLPANATNKAVSFRNDYSIIDIVQDTETSPVTIIAKKAGKDTLTIVSTDKPQITLTYYITVKERIVPDITLSFSTQTVNLSRLHDTVLTIAKKETDEVVADRVQLVFATVANGEPVATAVMADGSGLKWNVRGQYVGQYTVKIRYNGKEQTSTCTVNIPGEVTFRNGWDWISLYTAYSYPLTDNNGDYLASLYTNDKNHIIEIRSQKAVVSHDATFGFFGDLTQLTAADGAYKVNSTYESANDGAKVLNIGTTPGGSSLAAMMPQVAKGYTWIGYPHEHNHLLASMQKSLSATATEGDMIIGREAFAEFNGLSWQGSLKTFEAGKGYIYYTENDTPFQLDWGNYYMASDTNGAAARSMDSDGAAARAMADEPLPWQYDALKYQSSMPVVAQLSAGMAVGAFVDGECRGCAVSDAEGLAFLSVSGNPGERVSFMLCDERSGRISQASETAVFGAPQGSLRAPLMLTGDTSAISTAQAAALGIHFDGSCITVSGATTGQPLTVSVYNMAGRNVLTTTGHTTVSLQGMAKGIYTVKAGCGHTANTIKIAK